MKARNRELAALIPASLLITAGFAAVFIQRSNAISSLSLTLGLVFLALCVAGHIFIRLSLPHAHGVRECFDLQSHRFVIARIHQLGDSMRQRNGRQIPLHRRRLL